MQVEYKLVFPIFFQLFLHVCTTNTFRKKLNIHPQYFLELRNKPKLKIFKVIPYRRPSSSLGYSQAVKGTWEQYKKETNNKLATRIRFKDSVNFIGWYTNKTEKMLKISKKDAFRQYIAYHEGWGNYKNYKKKQKVILLAKKVQQQADKYRLQLKKCQKKLNRNKYIIF